MIQQLGRCRITAASFGIQNTSSWTRLINKSTFLPNPSLGSWNHTGLLIITCHSFLLQFLMDFCFLLYLISLLPTLKWFLIGLRAPSLLRGFAFPLELQGLLRHSADLWQVHFFAAQLSRTCLVSGLARWKGLKGDIIPSSLLGQGSLQLSLLDLQPKAISAPSFAKRRIAAPRIFWALLTGGVTGNINMLMLRPQMCEELLQRLCFIYFILNMKIFHLNQT